LSWLGNVLPDKKVIDEAKAKVMVELPLSNAVVVHRKGPTTMSVLCSGGLDGEFRPGMHLICTGSWGPGAPPLALKKYSKLSIFTKLCRARNAIGAHRAKLFPYNFKTKHFII